MTTKLGIVADDYTGALMVASYIEQAGIYCPLVFSPDAVTSDGAVIVAGTRVRMAPVQEAVGNVERMVAAFETAGYRRFGYKPSASFDSTAAGNVGPVADHLADRQGLRPVLMAAGLPRFAITTHQGYLFYRGRLVSDSIKRFDPLTPMSDPDLVRFLSQQTNRPIHLVDHLRMQRGSAAVAEAIDRAADDGAGHVFLDVSDEADVACVADLAAGRNAVLVASDSVMAAYARVLAGPDAAARPLPPHAKGPSAVLVGTVGPVIERQMAQLAAAHPVHSLDLLDPRGEHAIVEQGLAWAERHIGDGPFAIATSTGPSDVARVQNALGTRAAARHVEFILGAIAKGLRDRGVRRFVVAGGETSGAVVSALGIGAVRAFPEGPVGSGFCVSQDADPVSLFLKPGKHGPDDILLNALSEMA